jgi:hypothetical protein
MEAIDASRAKEADRAEKVPPRGRPGVLGRDDVSRGGFVPAGPHVRATVHSDETAGTVTDSTERSLRPVVLDRPAQKRNAVVGERR